MESLATKIATPLATSLAGVDEPSVPNLCVRYMFKGTTSHLSFCRYKAGDRWNGSQHMYCWRTVDTVLIDRLYTMKLADLAVGDNLYRYEDNSWVISDGVIEEQGGSIWTEKYTVLVLDGVPEPDYMDILTVTADGSEYSNTIQSFCICSATAGSTVNVTLASSNIVPVLWEDGSTERVRDFVVEPSNFGVIATRIMPYFTIATSCDAGSVSGGGIYDWGSSATLEVTPSSGYRFVRWSDGDTSNPRHVSNITADASYHAVCHIITYTLSFGTIEHCNVTVAFGPAPITLPFPAVPGAKFSAVATPEEGYHVNFDSWSSTPAGLPYTETPNGVEFTMPAMDIAINVIAS